MVALFPGRRESRDAAKLRPCVCLWKRMRNAWARPRINRSGLSNFLSYLGLATSPWSYCLSVDQLIRLSAHSSHGPTDNLIE